MQNRVDPAPHLSFTWHAYWTLGSERPLGFSGFGRIPFRAIADYADRYGVVGIDAFDRFRHLIMAMDRAFLERMMETRHGSSG